MRKRNTNKSKCIAKAMHLVAKTESLTKVKSKENKQLISCPVANFLNTYLKEELVLSSDTSINKLISLFQLARSRCISERSKSGENKCSPFLCTNKEIILFDWISRSILSNSPKYGPLFEKIRPRSCIEAKLPAGPYVGDIVIPGLVPKNSSSYWGIVLEANGDFHDKTKGAADEALSSYYKKFGLLVLPIHNQQIVRYENSIHPYIPKLFQSLTFLPPNSRNVAGIEKELRSLLLSFISVWLTPREISLVLFPE